VSGEAGDTIAKIVGGNDSNFLADKVVRVEMQGQLRVVLLDDDTRSLVHSLGSNATHGFGGKNGLERKLPETLLLNMTKKGERGEEKNERGKKWNV
jgi:hypothetical protein